MWTLKHPNTLYNGPPNNSHSNIHYHLFPFFRLLVLLPLSLLVIINISINYLQFTRIFLTTSDFSDNGEVSDFRYTDPIRIPCLYPLPRSCVSTWVRLGYKESQRITALVWLFKYNYTSLLGTIMGNENRRKLLFLLV